MLPLTATAFGENCAFWGNPQGGGFKNFHQLSFDESFMDFNDLSFDSIPGCSVRNKHDLTGGFASDA
jgi:hypothetical protein